MHLGWDLRPDGSGLILVVRVVNDGKVEMADTSPPRKKR